MTTEKVSATLHKDTLARVRTRAGRRGVSSYLEDAAREKLERDTRRARVVAYLKTLERDDPVTQQARDKALKLVAEILGS